MSAPHHRAPRGARSGGGARGRRPRGHVPVRGAQGRTGGGAARGGGARHDHRRAAPREGVQRHRRGAVPPLPPRRGWTSAHVETWARRIADLARLRRTETTLRRALARVRDGLDVPAEAQAEASALVATIAEDHPHAYDLTSHAAEAFEELQRRNEAHARALPVRVVGVAALDAPEALGGLTGGACTSSPRTPGAEDNARVAGRGGDRERGPSGAGLLAGCRGRADAPGGWRDGRTQHRAAPRIVPLRATANADLAAAMGQLAQMPIEIRDGGDATPDKIRAEVLAERARGGLGLSSWLTISRSSRWAPRSAKAPTRATQLRDQNVEAHGGPRSRANPVVVAVQPRSRCGVKADAERPQGSGSIEAGRRRGGVPAPRRRDHHGHRGKAPPGPPASTRCAGIVREGVSRIAATTDRAPRSTANPLRRGMTQTSPKSRSPVPEAMPNDPDDRNRRAGRGASKRPSVTLPASGAR